jgi:hypothetical protein
VAHIIKTVLGWFVQGAAKAIVGALVGSAAVAATVKWLAQSYGSLTGPALTALWLSVAFVAYVALVHLLSRFPKILRRSGQVIAAPLDDWSPWYRQPQTVVHHRTFENQVVLLDGYKYEHCRFRNVTFKITGAAPFTLVKPEMAGQVHIESAHPVLKSYDTLRDFIVASYPVGNFKGGIKDDYGNVNWTYEVKFDPDLDLNKKNGRS